MAIDQILALLIAERQKLDAAIQALGGTAPKRRGRPPKDQSLADAPSWVTGKPDKPERKKRKFTAKQRAEQSARAKAYWAAKKKTEAKSQPKTARKKTAKAA
jgi:hypothetical protein